MTEQLDRKTYLGGSDISAIVGADPYASPLTVYNRKLGIAEKEEPSFAMLRGAELEPGIMKLYARTREVFLGEAGVTPPHPLFPFLKGNYDRTRLDKKGGKPVVLVEAKTASIRQAHKWGEPGTGENKVPVNYYLQANYYCGLMGMEAFEIVALLMWKDDLQVYEFPFDADTFEMCCEEGARFWFDHVETRTPPPPEPSKSTQADLVNLFPQGTGEVVEATPELEALYKEAFELNKVVKTGSARLDEIKQQFQFYAKDASAIKCEDGVVKVVDKKGSVSWKNLAADLAKAAGIDLGSEQWQALTDANMGKSTRYVLLPFRGDWGSE